MTYWNLSFDVAAFFFLLLILIWYFDFKFVNNTYGVETGDRLLYQIGHFLERMPGNFADRVKQILEEYEVSLSQINIEITGPQQ